MKKRKLLFCIGSFFPAQVGGPSNSVYWMSNSLAEQGFHCDILTTSEGISSEHRRDYSIDFNKPTSVGKIRAIYFSYFYKFFIPKMAWHFVCNVRRYDVVFLNSIFFPLTWFFMLVCVVCKIPFVLSPRGELEPAALKYRYWLKNFLGRLFIYRLSRRSSCILCTSEEEAGNASVVLGKTVPTTIVPNLMPIGPRFSPKKIKGKNIIYLGRLHPKKGIENLIFALSYIVNDGYKLDIAGTGSEPYVKSLQELVFRLNLGSSVRFVGHLEAEKKRSFLVKASLLVLPSYSENFGNVVLEALSVGVPVVASKGTPWSGLEKFKCGCWVDNSPQALSDGILRILEQKQDSYQRISDSAYSYAVSNFSIDSNKKKFVAVVRSVTDARS